MLSGQTTDKVLLKHFHTFGFLYQGTGVPFVIILLEMALGLGKKSMQGMIKARSDSIEGMMCKYKAPSLGFLFCFKIQ